ncbi:MULTISPECIES: flagellar hook-associated protein FlgK [Methylomicrobium]|uniref:Flagellar hook-associated protein 1 n=1 Tax=Methylomicrobium album BG8 TaxID=686340 RepID=H8GNG3_METAL|nr:MULTISPECIES: flagellar hook-associated protein FlgK [Methylomicrobium]EIC29556.1 flagellar hook-associated protein FlgK [Methylomicrobium album BG8]
MAGTGILETALTGLFASQRWLATTSQNISNVNTEGYSRQQVELSARPPQFTGAGYIGQGVNVVNITRSYDQFINQQLNSSTSAFAESDYLAGMASQVDTLVGNNDSGLPVTLKSFFSAVNDVANDPTSLAARQAMLGQAGSLAQQFNDMASSFDGLRDQTNKQMQATLDDINTYAQSIADLNVKITAEFGRTGGMQMPNDLLDQRDALITKIAEKINVSALNMDDGSVNLIIGKGQSLVSNASAATLSLAGSTFDNSYKDIVINGQPITQSITGGELSGELKFRDQILDPAQQQLGVLAAALSVQFNAIHNSGFDLNGAPGQDLFALGGTGMNVPVTVNPGLPGGGSIAATYDPANTANLNPSDYRLDYDGTNYTLTRLSDKQAINIAGFPGSPVNVEGMTISLSTPPTGASSFLIRPAFYAAENLKINIGDPEEIAAAGNGASVPGDNTNALKLANLEQQPILSGGRSTLSSAYGQLVSQVGTSTQSAKTSQSAQQVLLNQAKQTRENLVGVNLDEEAANLIKFQNAYQAAAKAISVANSLFDTLIGAIR